MNSNNAWFFTHTGRRFHFSDPRPDDIDINDIAQGLSQACRFAGQTPRFYSVAEHSVCVSHLCEQHAPGTTLPLYGLLHDASEAFLCDIPKPFKDMPQMDGYREAEAIVQSAIYRHFGLSTVEPQALKTFDEVMLAIEWRDLFPSYPPLRLPHRQDYVSAAKIQVTAPLPSAVARFNFLDRFEQLMAVRVEHA